MFQNEQSAKGTTLYTHYCMHCHGERPENKMRDSIGPL